MGAFGALRVWSPYVGPGGLAPGGAGNGVQNFIAVWQDANVLGAGPASGNQSICASQLVVGRPTGVDNGVIQLQSSAVSGSGAAPFIRAFDSALTEMWRLGDYVGNSSFYVSNYSPTGSFIVQTDSTTGFVLDQNGRLTLGRAGDSTTDHVVYGNTEATAGAISEYWQIVFNGATRKIALYAVA